MDHSANAGPEDSNVTAAAAAAAADAVVPLTMLESALPPPQQVVVVLDATRDDRREEIRAALRGLVARGDILRDGDSLLLLGVLRPSKGCTACLTGTNSAHLQDQVSIKVEKYQEMLRHDVEQLRIVSIAVTLKIVASSSPAKDVIVKEANSSLSQKKKEANSSKAAWVVLDRAFRRDSRHFERFLSCKVATFGDCLSLRVLKSIRTQPACTGEGVNVLAATVAFEAGDPKAPGAELRHHV